MENGEDLYLIAADAVRDDKWGARDDEFSCPGYPTCPTHLRMMPESLNRRKNSFEKRVGDARTLPDEVLAGRLKVAAGERRPAHLHRRRRLAAMLLACFRICAWSVSLPASACWRPALI